MTANTRLLTGRSNTWKAACPTVVPRFPAEVGDREVDGEGRGPIRRQLELARREDEVLGAVGGLEPVVGQREARDPHLHLALGDGQLGVGSSGTCSPPVGRGRRAGLQHAASRSGP
jgi:hypothetical protein